MKQKDVSIIVIAAAFAAIFGFAITNLVFGGQKAYSLKSPKVDTISADFKLPDSKYFNANSLNPTRDITIGGNNNNSPFNGASQ